MHVILIGMYNGKYNAILSVKRYLQNMKSASNML